MNEPQDTAIEIAYVSPQQQLLMALRVAPGSTLASAVRASGILQQFPEIDLTRNKVGIFGRVVAHDHVLRDRDRIEIYRLLIADPKEVRRQRADAVKHKTQGGVAPP
jgi:Uncharacterized protein conserved in bacteria